MGLKAENETVKQRLAICNECPFFAKKFSRCKKCGCFMKLKARLNGGKCPIGKW